MLVENTIAVISGGASGIGKATVERYAENGANVVVADIDEEGGRETVREIGERDGEATFVQTDVTQPDDVQRMIETAVEEYGGIDVLFNNAGIEGPLAEVANYDEDAFERVIAVNLKGVFLGIKYGVQAMLTDGGGTIINTSSIASESGILGRSAYTASKAGINGLTRVAAVEYAEDDIRVNAVLPGFVRTPMQQRSADQQSTERLDRYKLSEAMEGIERPGDIADAVLFLGSDLASRITGITLPVDGGFLQQP
ncbi:SDR family oxidoreductase [Salinibaculum salinum]|uniref:SDR family NAD(P)-dependent oxidoreductase n=1 Tax=Salinibaculum salinum TaxID=3131996 RepID=UPI0030EBF2EE